MRIRGFLLFAAKIAVSAVLLYFAVRLVNFGALRERLSRIDYAWIAASVLALGLQIVLAGLRWQRIALACGAQIRRRSATLYTLIGTFFNQTLPSTVGGDAARIWLLARDTGAWKSAIFSVLIDRAVGLIWLAILVLVCLPWSLALIQNPIGRTAVIVIGAAGAAAPLGLAVFTWIGRTALQRWKTVRHLRDVAVIALTVLGSARIGPSITVVSIAIHLLTISAVWFCALAIGSPFTLLQSMLLIPAVILIAAVPVSIAGWGVRESAMIAAFSYAGLPDSDGLLVSVLFGLVNVIIGIVGGIAWSLRANHVRLASLREASDRALDI
jgi:uncharacterized membrane protein YbhN (UPF0104 family)